MNLTRCLCVCEQSCVVSSFLHLKSNWAQAQPRSKVPPNLNCQSIRWVAYAFLLTSAHMWPRTNVDSFWFMSVKLSHCLFLSENLMFFYSKPTLLRATQKWRHTVFDTAPCILAVQKLFRQISGTFWRCYLTPNTKVPRISSKFCSSSKSNHL